MHRQTSYTTRLTDPRPGTKPRTRSSRCSETRGRRAHPPRASLTAGSRTGAGPSWRRECRARCLGRPELPLPDSRRDSVLAICAGPGERLVVMAPARDCRRVVLITIGQRFEDWRRASPVQAAWAPARSPSGHLLCPTSSMELNSLAFHTTCLDADHQEGRG